MIHPTDFIAYIVAWLLYQLVQALFINGIFISAKGRSDKLDDGSYEHSEMILYPIYWFLNQTVPVRRKISNEYLKSNAPRSGWVNWDRYYPGKGYKILSELQVNRADVFDDIHAWAKGKNWDADLEGYIEYIDVYEEKEVYRFSKYIRKPIITCIICMASFWSIFTFLIPFIVFVGFYWWTIPLWIANVVSLSYVNYLVFKPRK